jgi:hypothetical protein
VVGPPLSLCLPLPSVSCPSPIASWASRLVWLRRGSDSWSRQDLANYGEFFFLLPCTSYSTLAQPPLSTHSWYNSRRQEVTEWTGGGDLLAADGVEVR